MDSEKKADKLIKKSPDDFRSVIKLSLELAKKEFQEKTRASGDKYINHSIDVALKLQEGGFDTVTVIGGLLHHIELNKTNIEFINQNISEDITQVIKSYNALDHVVKNTDASYTITTRYILNFVNDLRPVIIQIFNAQSNSHILSSIENDEEKRDIVTRNLNVYSNLAEYLGLDNIKTNITEEAFRITQKEDYEHIEKLYEKEDIDKKTLDIYKQYVQDLLKDLGGDFQLESRIKSKFSTFNKSKKYIKEGHNDPLNRITDLIGFRIITQTEQECYKVLDAIWDKGEIVIESFEDYISHPKPNGYKAMQGGVIFPEIRDMELEIQVLTKDMYIYNTYGPASHIAYKESKSKFAKPSNKYDWIKKVYDSIEKNREKAETTLSVAIDVDIFPEEIYALTPNGRIIGLTKGDTVTDFAYLIHTDIGNSMIGAKVNGKSVTLDYKLHTGDIVEIITQKGKKYPKSNLLGCANSQSTKAKIERAIKQI